MPFDFSKLNFRKKIRKENKQKEPFKREEKDLSARERAFRKAFRKRKAKEDRMRKDKLIP